MAKQRFKFQISLNYAIIPQYVSHQSVAALKLLKSAGAISCIVNTRTFNGGLNVMHSWKSMV